MAAEYNTGGRMDEDNWKHRSKGMQCQSCMWFAPKAADGVESRLGRCRRHAPNMHGYPGVFITDWCGDHKLDESKLEKKSALGAVIPS